MKKILFLIHDLMYGGAEKVLVNLVNNMDKSQYDITVMTLFDVGINKQFLNSDIKYKYVFKKMFRGNSQILKIFSPNFLYKKIIKEDYDVVIAYLEGSCTRIVSGCNNTNTKTIGWVHIVEDESEFSYTYRSKKEAVDCYKKLDKIVCVSKDIKANIEKLTGIKENVVVCYNTNETEQIIKKSNELVGNIIPPNNKLKICGVGKIEKRKGFMRLAKVHKKLIEEGFEHEIYILGEGSYKSNIEKYLDKNNLNSSFKFLGYKENPYKYISKCDLLVCSSMAEGFSTAISEALIIGIPVVSTLCSGSYELLGENNEFGIVVENSQEGIYDGLKLLLKDRDLLNYYTNKAKERGTFFSKEKTVKEVQKMLDNL